MAVGARDYIDQLLVQKYATEKVDNPTLGVSVIPPEKMYSAMNDYAAAQQTMLSMHTKLRGLCLKATTKAIKYRPSQVA